MWSTGSRSDICVVRDGRVACSPGYSAREMRIRAGLLRVYAGSGDADLRFPEASGAR